MGFLKAIQVIIVGLALCPAQSGLAAGPISVDKKIIPERREFPVNTAVNPCDNFFDYACSKAIENFELREDRSSHTFAFSDSRERLLEKTKNFFAGLSKRQVSSAREKSLKNYYLACQNPVAGAKGEKSEIDRVKKLYSGLKTRDQLLSWLENSYLTTEQAPVSWGATSSLDTPVKSDIVFNIALLSLPEKTYYKKADVMADFKNLAVQFFKTIKMSDPEKRAEDLLKFESEVAEQQPLPDQFRQIVNNRSFISREELFKKFPNLKLEKLMKKVPDGTLIRNWVPEAMNVTNQLIGTLDVESVKNVFLYHSLAALIDDSYPEFFNLKFEFEKKHFGGPPKRADRVERCTRKVSRIFGKEVDAILLPEFFPSFDKQKFVDVAEKVRSSLIRSLEANTWLSASAQTEALNKMKKAKLFLVSPNNEKEWDFLPEETYDPKDPIGNSKKITKIYQDREMRDLKEDMDPARWGMGPLTVNAYYDPSYNKFVMPVGILQYPFYDAAMTLDENLAASGSVVGHELGHGVDDQGSRYDSEGKQRLWMTMEDLAGFSKRSEKLIGQFDKAKHNGKLTLGENIGDLVGLTASFEAASQDPAFLKSNDRIQKFYLAYARVWCEVKRPKYIESQLKTDPHSLGVARVNEQMKQQPPFKKAFQCKTKDQMTLPESEMVRIW